MKDGFNSSSICTAEKFSSICETVCADQNTGTRDTLVVDSLGIGAEEIMKEDVKVARLDSSGDVVPLSKEERKEHLEALKRKELNEELGNAVENPAPRKQPTYVNAALKVGRNAPCPCGSQKKYKKCCLGKGSKS